MWEDADFRGNPFGTPGTRYRGASEWSESARVQSAGRGFCLGNVRSGGWGRWGKGGGLKRGLKRGMKRVERSLTDQQAQETANC